MTEEIKVYKCSRCGRENLPMQKVFDQAKDSWEMKWWCLGCIFVMGSELHYQREGKQWEEYDKAAWGVSGSDKLK